MARTKQVAFIRRYNHKSPVFLDHCGNSYTVVGATPDSCSNPSTIIKLSIHLYTLSALTEPPEEIGSKLLSSHGITGSGNLHDYWPRVDVYSPLGSIEECMEHHRAEKIYRNKAVEEMHREARASADNEEGAEEAVRSLRGKQPLPHIVPSWACTERFWNQYSYGHGWRYRSFILVVPEDCRCWDDVEEKGLWIVCFDQDVTPAMETHMWDCQRDEDLEIDNGEGWVEVERIEYGPPVLIKRVSLCREDQQPGGRGNSTITSTLYDMWNQITRVLNDCTYRHPLCYGCAEDAPHECELEMDDHYFDEDAQCVACRQASEYRRRSKRLNCHGEIVCKRTPKALEAAVWKQISKTLESSGICTNSNTVTNTLWLQMTNSFMLPIKQAILDLAELQVAHERNDDDTEDVPPSFGSGRRQRVKRFETKLAGWFGRVVCDEGHAAKTVRTRVHQAVARLEALHVWFLTATPLYNWAFDLCGYLAILYSGLRRSNIIDDTADDTDWFAEYKQYANMQHLPTPPPYRLLMPKAFVSLFQRGHLAPQNAYWALPAQEMVRVAAEANDDDAPEEVNPTTPGGPGEAQARMSLSAEAPAYDAACQELALDPVNPLLVIPSNMNQPATTLKPWQVIALAVIPETDDESYNKSLEPSYKRERDWNGEDDGPTCRDSPNPWCIGWDQDDKKVPLDERAFKKSSLMHGTDNKAFTQLPSSVGGRESTKFGNEDESTNENLNNEIDIDACETGGITTMIENEDFSGFLTDHDELIQEDLEDETGNDTLSKHLILRISTIRRCIIDCCQGHAVMSTHRTHAGCLLTNSSIVRNTTIIFRHTSLRIHCTCQLKSLSTKDIVSDEDVSKYPWGRPAYALQATLAKAPRYTRDAVFTLEANNALRRIESWFFKLSKLDVATIEDWAFPAKVRDPVLAILKLLGADNTTHPGFFKPDGN
ncbi:uncharacterized protein CDV56_108085 [Aspergillus thermomutatus]|uniref:SNF2 N-terminal domain-containing protein n=1 Tax=Aspergillus thermomutatus TaxID=41047 RepID=A0A397HVU0_ASPTH|nr:uncharacterized protein CDV56_108085 [Aspergillus thermomutatus]RHZ67335.1 hypothetical protein CDV56_108085 [Aspergillus thermomutatus]